MSRTAEEWKAAFEAAAPGASREALACFLWLLAQGTTSPAGLAKGLGLPQATVLRAVGELQTAGLADWSAPHGRAGRRKAALTEDGIRLSAGEAAPRSRPRPHADR